MVCHWPSSYEDVLVVDVVNVVRLYGLAGGVLEGGHEVSGSELVDAVMVAGTVAVDMWTAEGDEVVEDEAGRVGVEDGLATDEVGVATGGGGGLVLVLVAVAAAEVASSVTVCVLTMVTSESGVVPAGWMDTTEMPVSVAVVTVSLVEAATVFVSGGEVTVWVMVVVEGGGGVPPSMGTTEYRGRRAWNLPSTLGWPSSARGRLIQGLLKAERATRIGAGRPRKRILLFSFCLVQAGGEK